MNPHAPHSTSLVSLGKCLWVRRQLIKQLAWREIVGRYRGSILGMLWPFIIPILMLGIYTFVFSVVFKAKWNIDGEEDKAAFALLLYSGLIIHGLLAEVLNRAPNMILGNASFVKKVVFPLEILPVVSLVAAIFHCAIGIIVLLLAAVAINGSLPWTAIYIPFVLLPLITLALGLAWILSALGVFIRDISQTMGIITTILLFTSTVFFPLSALPEKYHLIILANPLTFIIEQLREILIFGHAPNWLGLGTYMLIAFATTWISYVCFQLTRKVFADVM